MRSQPSQEHNGDNDPEDFAAAYQLGLPGTRVPGRHRVAEWLCADHPRGSTMVLDDDHIALWERGKGSTTAALKDGTKVTVYFRKPQLRADGVLPKGGIARFYGTASVVKSGTQYEEVWRRLVQPEKDRDPDKKGFAVLIKVERAEDLDGVPLTLE